MAIKMNFREFYSGEWVSDDQFYELYIISKDDDIFYIGISRDSVWHRWFGGRGHIPNWNTGCYCASTVGCRIIDNLPRSWEYTVELYTLGDARQAVDNEWMDIDGCERIMIQRYEPRDNTIHNPRQRPYQIIF